MAKAAKLAHPSHPGDLGTPLAKLHFELLLLQDLGCLSKSLQEASKHEKLRNCVNPDASAIAITDSPTTSSSESQPTIKMTSPGLGVFNGR